MKRTRNRSTCSLGFKCW